MVWRSDGNSGIAGRAYDPCALDAPAEAAPQKSWKESMPTAAHADLRIMLIVGNATLCAVDRIDGAAHGLVEGNIVSFICHLNLIGWGLLYGKYLRSSYNLYSILPSLPNGNESWSLSSGWQRMTNIYRRCIRNS